MIRKRFILLLIVCAPLGVRAQKSTDFDRFVATFQQEYGQLGIPEMTYDYTEYFSSIPDSAVVKRQVAFFTRQQRELQQFNREKLNAKRQLLYDHLVYELNFNLSRTALELNWLRQDRPSSAGGLAQLPHHEQWYNYFIRKFTSLDTSPETIQAYGQAEVNRINHELDSLCRLLGFNDRASMRAYLSDSSHFFYETTSIKREFAKTDSIIRSHLPSFVGKVSIPVIAPIEWPDAGEYTPPGIYLNKADNLYGSDVFMYNFYGDRFNKRSIEWLYLHEAIPGHHLQASLRQKEPSVLGNLFSYPGNFEGWACYVEDCGSELGMYKDPLSYLGKCEWDLVRSARLVLDVGIHYQGWSADQAMDYWHTSIEGLDHLADREIQRVTNWPGQALSYKIGAHFIHEQFRTFSQKQGNQFDQIRFYRTFLDFGMLPLPVILTHLEKKYHNN